jgi:hypothetical protein
MRRSALNCLFVDVDAVVSWISLIREENIVISIGLVQTFRVWGVPKTGEVQSRATGYA